MKSFRDHNRLEAARVWQPTAYSRVLKDLLDLFDVSGRSVLDVGCGTGILALSAAKRGAEAFASDIVLEAVHATEHNAACSGLSVMAQQSDGLQYWTKMGKMFDFVICNPPCVDILSLSTEPAQDPNENSFLIVDVLQHYEMILKRPGCLLFAVSGRENMEWVRQFIQEHNGAQPSVNAKHVPVEEIADEELNILANLGLVKELGGQMLWDAYYFCVIHL